MSRDESDILDSIHSKGRQTTPGSGYSATVQMELFVNGQRFSVGQVGRGMLVFDEPVLLPGTQGELVLTVDGHPRRWHVSLPPVSKPSRIIEAELRNIN